MDPGTSFQALGLSNKLFNQLGCYGFFEEGKCLYVGQASNPETSSIKRRLKDHYFDCRNFTKTSDEIKIWVPDYKVGSGSDSNRIKDLELLILLHDPSDNVQKPTRGHEVADVLKHFESEIKELAN